MIGSPTISLPQGVRDILPEEAERIGAVESGILSVFSKYGFRKIITPLLEYVDVLSLGVGGDLRDRVIKFIDPSTGRVIAIRPDITPQIARVVATRMRDHALPLKLCYNENVIRYIEPRDGKSSEVLQIGAEHISAGASPEADAHMIIMAVEALGAAGLKDFKIDIGDVGFLRNILASHFDEGLRKTVQGMLEKKDSSGLTSFLNGMDSIKPEEKELLINLTTFYGEEEVIEKAASLTKDKAALASLEYLSKVIEIIAAKGLKEWITIDLGEVRGFDYYTGIIFEGFASGIGKPILSGGRYDNLLERYGYPCAATGFAFDVEHLAAAIGMRSGRKS
ncbi:MAG TPA: ATP phosphoribosyltransferase regulatory subunit [Deltaproteobacteria bacterium]|nr:MAG: ATP phosphoribosyltransferase regulatory subunit [Deltaproteobacteria bacterium GWA2_55_82]OGQ62268.1 MAG: ATP phosphoribosyltransferase regulatory subunit [Deltaproteobacteria bacterium RIFCSPLOWO2_02_FULL_55_12]OIJ74380.1 MAG: ATP phosphoribosyltransferase regulatory subunit [Deltaproteobacteria bacterium GWC2_55_46]HBG47028.1 ATP phosphoribosyltransferase regulatory subunit [Deltaproteobacteria bacterium]HCY10912.1 ATP phosphoribosyltransferase regulatory subunit [Deltaproteobacteria